MNTKRLVLAASLVLFAAISGSAAARTVTTGERQSTNATDASAEIQSSLFEPGTASLSQPAGHDLHRYYGGPKSND